MDFQEFVRVSASCRRWSDKSLAIVRALLVEEISPSDCAREFDVSAQHVNVLRTRFINKAQQLQLKDYMQQTAPDYPQLERYKQQIEKLNEKGYSVVQIVNFLKQTDIEVTEKDVTNFLKGNGS